MFWLRTLCLVLCRACLQHNPCTTEANNNLVLAATYYFNRQEACRKFACRSAKTGRLLEAPGHAHRDRLVESSAVGHALFHKQWSKRVSSQAAEITKAQVERLEALRSHRTSSTRTGRIGSVRFGRLVRIFPRTRSQARWLRSGALERTGRCPSQVYSTIPIASLVMMVGVQTQVWAQLFGDLQLAIGRVWPSGSKFSNSVNLCLKQVGAMIALYAAFAGKNCSIAVASSLKNAARFARSVANGTRASPPCRSTGRQNH